MPVTISLELEEAEDSLSLNSSVTGACRSRSLLPRMLPKEGRAGLGFRKSSNSSNPRLSFCGDFFFPAPNQFVLNFDFPEGDSGMALSSGDVGGLAATPTISASSPKLTLADFLLYQILEPSSDATEVPSDSSLRACPGRPTVPVLPSGDKESLC